MGETPMSDGEFVGRHVGHSVRLRYQGLSESKWETVNENREEAEPFVAPATGSFAVPPMLLFTGGVDVTVAVDDNIAADSYRRDEVRNEKCSPEKDVSKSGE